MPTLRQASSGDESVCIAIIDGAIDFSHPCLKDAKLTLIPQNGRQRVARHQRHGTQVASIIFGQGSGPVIGIAPKCRGIFINPYKNDGKYGLETCSQLDLARAIAYALEAGADVINISAGEVMNSGNISPFLRKAVSDCATQGVLIVAAAGNQGCACLSVPAAMPSVLAIGAMDENFQPLEISNWGASYRTNGILALGRNILTAIPSGEYVIASGTSFATAVVSGVVALLLCIQRQRGLASNARDLKQTILRSAAGCNNQVDADCRRILAGRLNIPAVLSLISSGGVLNMTSSNPTAENSTQSPMIHEVQASVESASSGVALAEGPPPCEAPNGDSQTTNPEEFVSQSSSSVSPETSEQTVTPDTSSKGRGCGCSANRATQLVYALGKIGYDFGSEPRQDYFGQMMGRQGLNPSLPEDLVKFLAGDNVIEAEGIIWTLEIDDTMLYAINPTGAFALQGFARLVEYLKSQIEEGAERLSVPGVLNGEVMLTNGQVLPVIEPKISGMFNWTTSALTEAVCGKMPSEKGKKEAYEKKSEGLRRILDRIYYDYRNLGVTSEERALNYSATNAYEIENAYEDAVGQNMELDMIDVQPSPICRPGSDCWDVKLVFFVPSDPLRTSREVHRFTVDVSDVVPVTVGPRRRWSTR